MKKLITTEKEVQVCDLCHKEIQYAKDGIYLELNNVGYSELCVECERDLLILIDKLRFKEENNEN